MIIDSRWHVALAGELALRGKLDADDIRGILEERSRGSPSSALGATNRESAIVRHDVGPERRVMPVDVTKLLTPADHRLVARAKKRGEKAAQK
jgi:hypothetical protein